MATRSRRQLLAGSAALLLAGCGGSGNGGAPKVKPADRAGDAIVLNALLDMERAAAVAYGVVGGRVGGALAAEAARFGAHERAHAAALERALRSLGAAPLSARLAQLLD